MSLLTLEDLHVQVEQQVLLQGINLTIEPGQLHLLMGRNGAGKSSLAHTLVGKPGYQVS